MVKNFEDLQKINKDNMDAAMKSFGAVSKGAQAIAAQTADFSKKALEEGTQAFEKLFGAKTVEHALEIQTGYFKGAYESFIAEASKLGTLYTDLAKETYKPYEGYFAGLTPAK